MSDPLPRAPDQCLRALVRNGGAWSYGCGWRFSSARGTEKALAALLPYGFVSQDAERPCGFRVTAAGRAYVAETGGVDADYPDPPGFVCVICEREVSFRWGPHSGPGAAIAPLCYGCETGYANRAPQVGAFRDRRKLAQLSALANALSGEAYSKKWKDEHPDETRLRERPGFGDVEPGQDDPRPIIRLRRPPVGEDHGERRDCAQSAREADL